MEAEACGGSIGCVITSFVCRFDVLVIASAKRVNIPDVKMSCLVGSSTKMN